MKKDINIGFMGECYVLYKFSTLGIKGENLKDLFDYDILLDNGCKIEVKTSKINTASKKVLNKNYEWDRWQFHNHILDNKTQKTYKRDRACDFFILICLDKNEKICNCFIVPKAEITKSQSITIPVNSNRTQRYDKYKENWDLIVKNYFD